MMSWSSGSVVWGAAEGVLPELGRAVSTLDADRPAVAEAAQALLRRAEREAQALLEAARQKAASQVEEGYREGRLQGRAEALQEWQERLAAGLGGLAQAAKELHALETTYRVQGEEAVIGLAVTLAERIVRRAVRADPAEMGRLVHRALEVLPEPGRVRIRIEPEAAAILGEAAGTPPEAEIVADPSLQPGDCLVEASLSLLDARIGTMLEEARHRLLEEAW